MSSTRPVTEADLEVGDLIYYMADAPDIKVIVTTLEGVRNGPRFVAAALHAAKRGKPIVALKVGKSEYGAKAAQSHTAAIAGSAEINSAVFRELGIVEADDIDELIDVASLLSRATPTGRERLAVYSFSGRTAALASDMVGTASLELATFTGDTLSQLRAALPDYAAIDNPVDVTAEVLVDSSLSYTTIEGRRERYEHGHRAGADSLSSTARLQRCWAKAWSAFRPKSTRRSCRYG
ncbi:hypothetical protein [Caballeronia arvi]|nr:hypothetical protein [Caballeronia arvi]